MDHKPHRATGHERRAEQRANRKKGQADEAATSTGSQERSRRSVMRTTWLTQDEAREVDKAALRSGISVKDFIRTLLHREIR